MIFQKELQYLGMQENKFQDGSSYYKVSFFDPEAGSPVAMNVGGGNGDLLGVLQSMKFGTLILCQIELVQKDKLYRLALRNVAALK